MKLSKLFKVTLCSFLALSTILMTDITTKADTTYSTEATNLALNSTVTVSSVENASLDGRYAIDGDMATRWSSQWSDNQWITLDLGDTCKLGCVNVYWEAARASRFEVAISDDGVNWFTCASVGVATEESIVPMYNRTARYIKLTGVSRATTYGYSIYDIKVTGYAPVKEEPVITKPVYSTEVTNLALGKKATATTIENADYDASKAIDGDLNTRWSSQFMDNQSITVDLGEPCIVGSVGILWEAAYASKYSVSISDDGVNWFTCATMGNSLLDSSVMMYQRTTRYVKVTGLQRATAYGISIYELKILGYAQIH